MRSRYRLLPDVRSPQFQPSEHDADGRADVADLTVIAGLFGGGERLARSHIYLIASSAYCLGPTGSLLPVLLLRRRRSRPGHPPPKKVRPGRRAEAASRTRREAHRAAAQGD